MYFFKEEKPFLLSVIAVILLTFFISKESIHASVVLTAIAFIAIFLIIMYSAFNVVNHAEVLAHRLGEPYGTMILTFSAVTVEVIMISTMMLHEDTDPTLARDTIFSTIMILLNGLIGIIMLIGGLKFGDQKYNMKSTNSFFSMIFGIVGLGLFLPNLLNPVTHPIFYTFLIIAALLLYIFFIRMQSKEQNYYFKFTGKQNSHKEHSESIGKLHHSTLYHVIMLIVVIAAISVLAESMSVLVDEAIENISLPAGLASLIVAIIIVSPEGLTAIRAGLTNDMQRVINISLGSALSTIALTIPAVLLVGFIFNREVLLGITPLQGGLIVISLLIGILSYKDGETNALQGFIHVVLFITFVFLIFLM